MRQIISIFGDRFDTDCIGCTISRGLLKHYKGNIGSWNNFHAHQDIEIPLPGFIILSTTRHIHSVAEFNSKELEELPRIMWLIKKAQESAGIKMSYIFQNEDSSDHFHLWFFPIYDWMRKYGKGIDLLCNVVSELKKTSKHSKKEILGTVEEIKTFLRKNERNF